MNFTRFLGVSSIIWVGLSACGVQSTASREKIALPADWKNAAHFPVAAPARDLTRWWSRFDDPTLTHIISSAFGHSPDVASASARIREAQSRRNIETASNFPTLRGSASANDGFGSDSNSAYAAGLNASWEADLFGKRRSRIEAASAQIGAAEENFHSVQAALAAEIAIAYTQLRVSEAALSVLRRTIQTREETSRLASWRTQAGAADSLESSQAGRLAIP
jgi:outer membrane protein TolC